MTRYLITLALFLISIPCQAALTFTVDWTGTPTTDDLRAARLIVQAENARRATLDPPGTPLLFDGQNNATKAASYKASLAQIVSSAHDDYINQAKEELDRQRREAYRNATPEQQSQIDAILGITGLVIGVPTWLLIRQRRKGS